MASTEQSGSSAICSRQSPSRRLVVIEKNQTRPVYHCHSVAQAFRIVHSLPITGEQRGFVPASEVMGLPFKSYEPLESWPTSAGPYFDISHHERLRKAIKNAHNKAPALDRLGQKQWERK